MRTLYFKERRLVRVSEEVLPEDEAKRVEYLNAVSSMTGADKWILSDVPYVPGRTFLDDGGNPVDVGDAPSIYHQMNLETMEWFDGRTQQALTDALIAEILLKRSTLLQESDWTQLPDVPEQTRLKWVEYRQALRDITDQPGYPQQVSWPVPPS